MNGLKVLHVPKEWPLAYDSCFYLTSHVCSLQENKNQPRISCYVIFFILNDWVSVI